MLKLIWEELKTPTGQTGPLSEAYLRAMQGVGHAVLGAALAAPFGVWGLPGALAIAATYWLLKERGDLRRGGRVLDGIEDALMVYLGTFYGAWWWPAMILGAAIYIMASAAWREK